MEFYLYLNDATSSRLLFQSNILYISIKTLSIMKLALFASLVGAASAFAPASIGGMSKGMFVSIEIRQLFVYEAKVWIEIYWIGCWLARMAWACKLAVNLLSFFQSLEKLQRYFIELRSRRLQQCSRVGKLSFSFLNAIIFGWQRDLRINHCSQMNITL